ncbi:flavin-dependent monooxygenase QhpG [Aromatoleum petrolei]|uniref:FAD-binding domain-containing protein n=1 Tax=Aromatoleum petrolei TaxID=76116 RepID=A0ABX1MRM9_9RHOO|nr:FAD-dependent monooxygenase [Aromatoleum petrolei]NMF88995.1 hypothetical protein [Aromatoleum petrolei]QTQ34355.1 Uncharacterized protein ToN1_01710 [Aromatoleum petrolei]
MNPVVILGAGPSACLLALALARGGQSALVIGQPRQRGAAEGLSQRVIEALRQFGCSQALSMLGPRWLRVSSWNGAEVEMNGEFVVERVAFDRALLADVRASGIDVREGKVRTLEHVEEGMWYVHWEDQSGRSQRTAAQVIVECRGRTAPKKAPDLQVEAMRVAVARTFTGAAIQPRTTYVESFAQGWAWGAVEASGLAHIQIVVLPESVSAHGGDLDATHAACFEHLHGLRRRFGRNLRPVGPARARGIQPALRGGVASRDFLRVGDSAYSCDPLSGHGVFEAASGAIAAAPVINTLLQRPDDASLAVRYFTERASEVFASRVTAAHEHYRSETRWPDAEFWERAIAPRRPSMEVPEIREPAFVMRPVVEDGFITDRSVVVSDEHPRGVRFIGGIDLARLDQLVRTLQVPDPERLSRLLSAPHESVCRALHWLQARRLAPRPVQ